MKSEGDKSMRQIWEKETKLTKEEVHERLEKYFTDNKYIHAMFSCLFILLVVGYILTKLYFVLDFDCLMRLSFVVGPHWLSMFHVADW